MTNRVRNWVLLSVLSLAACSRHNAAEPPDLPKSVSPGWRMTSLSKLDINTSPDAVRAAHPQAAWRATYTGPGTGHVRVWALPGPSGLDLAQKWRPQPNTVVVFSERYFAAVDWDRADHADVITLVRGIERSLGPPSQPR